MLQMRCGALLSVLFFTIGVAAALAAWRYGEQAWLILLLPAVWALSSFKANGFLLFFGYYLAFAIDAPETLDKFDGTSLASGKTLWIAHAALLSLPWVRIAEKKWLQVAVVLPLMALPPLGAFNWGHPLIAAGEMLPGAGLPGLFLCYAAIVWVVWVVESRDLAILCKHYITIPASLFAAVCISHVVMYEKKTEPEWIAINTSFGGSSRGLLPFQRHQEMAKSARQGVGQAGVIVFPEQAGGEWTDRKLVFWHELRNSNIPIIVGGDVKLPDSDNQFLNAAIDARNGYVIASARVPMPVGNWKLEGASSKPDIFKANVKTLAGRKASFIFCYEETLVYPLAFDVAAGAETIISMANTWSTAGTPARDMQRRSIEMQAKLYGLPLIRAENI